MFNFPKSQQDQSSKKNPLKSFDPPESEEEDIHTMPEKFVAEEPTIKSRKKVLIIGGIILASLIILIGGAILLFNRIIKPTNNQNITLANQDQNLNANLNANLNQNKNVNQNLNTNVNANLNVNQNLNTNVNANLNANQNLNANVNTNANLNLNISPYIPDSVDSDNDGLTDKEETVFTTNSHKPDTDADGYLDKQEIIAGYNPKGSGKLENSGLVKTYKNPTYNYSVLYPSPWLVQATSQSNLEVIFSSDTGEFIEVIVEDNPSKLSAKEWYILKSPGIDEGSLENVVVGGLLGIKSSDGFNIYLAKEDKIYVITYNYGTKPQVNFRVIFQMMSEGFQLISNGSLNSNLNTNTNLNTNQNTNTNANLNANLNQNQNTNANFNEDLPIT